LLFALMAQVGVRIADQRAIAAAAPDAPAKLKPIPARERERLESAAQRIASLQVKKRAPGPNDWLVKHGTEERTFDEYLASNPNRLNRQRTTLYVQPIGEMTPARERIVETTRELLGIFYNVPAKALAPVELNNIPADMQRQRSEDRADDQILTSYLLEDILAPRRPRNAVAVLGLTARDLYPAEDWNYVFGQASFYERVGIHSFHRYGDPDASPAEFDLCLLRTLKVAVHETGHMFGLPHCRTFECGMNGSNHKEELDSNVLCFCVDCEKKLWWACRLPIRERYQKLVQFAADNKLADQERLWRAHLERFEK